MKLSFKFNFCVAICLVIICLLLICFFCVSSDYNNMDHNNRLLPPNAKHILGTDNFGRDIFLRIMAGGKNSLLLAVCTVAAASAAGTLLGLIAGYLGGLIGEIIMRLIDTINSFPGIVLALLLIAIMDNSQFSLFVALVILFTPSFTRVMRAGAMQYRNASFVQAEKILGAGFFRIMFIHILPNLAPSLISASVLGLSNAILAEAAMSYLGLGIQPPEPSWGRMLFEAQTWFFNAPWYAMAPGFSILFAVLAFHLLGDKLRQRFGI